MASGDTIFCIGGNSVNNGLLVHVRIHTVYVPLVFISSALLDNGVIVVKYQNLCQCFLQENCSLLFKQMVL